MTANNCDDTESLFDAFPEATRILEIGRLETENAQLTQRLANVIDNNRELMFERDALREAEARAWRLVDDVWLTVQLRGVGSGDYTDELRKISTALAARKAGG